MALSAAETALVSSVREREGEIDRKESLEASMAKDRKDPSGEEERLSNFLWIKKRVASQGTFL